MPPIKNFDAKNTLEDQLLKEISQIEIRIAELNREKTTLERLLSKARRENAALRDVTRRNSVDRILIENAILESLRAIPEGRPVTSVFDDVKAGHPALKPATFRSYLHRLAQRGEIQKVPGRRGSWAVKS